MEFCRGENNKLNAGRESMKGLGLFFVLCVSLLTRLPSTKNKVLSSSLNLPANHSSLGFAFFGFAGRDCERRDAIR